jgi:hypothetical protein
MSRPVEEDPPHLDVQSEKASDYNYYDHYADDVEDVHLVCSSLESCLVETDRCFN